MIEHAYIIYSTVNQNSSFKLWITPEKFYSWTGVEPSSCGMGNGLSAEEERNMCINGGKLKWL